MAKDMSGGEGDYVEDKQSTADETETGEQDYLAEMVESMSPDEMKKVIELCNAKLAEGKSNEVLDMDELDKSE